MSRDAAHGSAGTASMPDEPTPPSTTDDALRLFIPGQEISIQPLDSERPPVSFTICKLSTPVTKSIVLLATPMGDPEPVVIKIFDPRYLDERISTIPSRQSYPWNLSNEQAAATARIRDLALSDNELEEKIYSDEPGEDHYPLWEERFYRLLKNSYNSEHRAYERLKDLQGSAIPRLILAGKFLPPDERAIQPSTLVLEYIPSVSLRDIPSDAITPEICSQVLSAIKSFPLHGVIHNDITLTNIRFTPPERPMKAFVIDFGCAFIREESYDEEDWVAYADSDLQWVRRLLEDTELRDSLVANGCGRSGF